MNFSMCGLRLWKSILMITLLVTFWGCQSTPEDRLTDATPDSNLITTLESLPAVRTVSTWNVPDYITKTDQQGLTIHTRHYAIYTTVDDGLMLRQVPVFLEAAYRGYQEVLIKPVETQHHLRVYFFRNRRQWEAFTRRHTSEMSQIFLKITSGAYYFNGACVVYHLSRRQNLAVLAHEGWHQFSRELFKYHLPAWVDEGVASNFEAYTRRNGNYHFDPRYNGGRLLTLKRTLEQGQWLSIKELLTRDPGQVILQAEYLEHDQKEHNGHRLAESYYAQVYGLVRFLREAEYARRFDQFRRLIEDGRLGRWTITNALKTEASNKLKNPSRLWNQHVGINLFQQYIEPDITALDQAYLDFCRGIVSKLQLTK